MTTPDPLPVRLARSLTLSALGVCAAVLAHVVADGHTPALRTVLVVAAAVTLVDLVAGTWLRGPSTLALRLAGLQAAVHVALSVAAVGGGSVAVGGAHHTAHAVVPAADVAWSDLVPSAPMLLAHVLVAAVTAAALTSTGRGVAVPAAARRVVAMVRALGVLVVAIPAVAPDLRADVLRTASTPPAARPLGHQRLSPVVVRRGPPALLPA